MGNTYIKLPKVSGGAGSGITELTGDVTAGPGSGSQAATVASVGGQSAANVAAAAAGFATRTLTDTFANVILSWTDNLLITPASGYNFDAHVIGGGTAQLSSPLSYVQVTDGNGVLIYAGEAGVNIGTVGNFTMFTNLSGFQFGDDGSVNLYNSPNGFNFTASPGGEVQFDGNGSAFVFRYTGAVDLYSSGSGDISYYAGGNIFLSATGGYVLCQNKLTSLDKIGIINDASPVTYAPIPSNGGSLVDGVTYYYASTATVFGIESNLGAEVSSTITAPDQILTVQVNQIPGSDTYTIYRGTSPGVYDGIIYQSFVGFNTNMIFVDDGTVTPFGPTVPPTNSYAQKTTLDTSGIYTTGDVALFGNLRLLGLASGILDANGISFIDIPTRILKSQNGSLAITFDETNRYLHNIGGGPSLIFGSPDYSGIALPNGLYNSNDNTQVMSPNDRTLIQADGSTIALDYSNGLKLNSNTSGIVTLSGGTATVSSSAVAANSIIMLTAQTGSGLNSVGVTSRSVGTSFTITSSNPLASNDIGWMIVQQ